MEQGYYSNPRPLQIVKFQPAVTNDAGKTFERPKSLVFDHEILRTILCHESVCGLPVVSVSMIGAFQCGKSFLLNILLHYLKRLPLDQRELIWETRMLDETEAMIVNQSTTCAEDKENIFTWFGDEKGRLDEGFAWQAGAESCTDGIWIWSKAIRVRMHQKTYALLLLDTQGMFSMKAGASETALMLKITSQLSSLFIYNVRGLLTSDTFDALQFFVHYGREVSLKMSNNVMYTKSLIDRSKPFQELMILTRDWRYPANYSYGFEGGKNYLTRFVDKVHKVDMFENQKVCEDVVNCFDNVTCCLLPDPGECVAQREFCGQLENMSVKFKVCAAEFCKQVVFNSVQHVKRIGNVQVTCAVLYDIVANYASAWNKMQQEPSTGWWFSPDRQNFTSTVADVACAATGSNVTPFVRVGSPPSRPEEMQNCSHVRPTKPIVLPSVKLTAGNQTVKPIVGEFEPNSFTPENFNILGRLGKGEYDPATITKVLHKQTDIVMARKQIQMNTDSKINLQQRREIEISQTVNSPRIVRCYGLHTTPDQICSLYYEFMNGNSLGYLYKTHGRIPEKVLAVISVAVLEGLDYLENLPQKVLHRDVKPQNILVNTRGEVKLCNFSLSRLFRNVDSVANTYTGTRPYMSPERLRGQPATIAGDIWSLGWSLIELATGRYPIPKCTDDEERDWIENGRLSDRLVRATNTQSDFQVLAEIEAEPPVSVFAALFTENFKTFVDCCLRMTPEERPTVEDLLQMPFCRNADIADLIDWIASKNETDELHDKAYVPNRSRPTSEFAQLSRVSEKLSQKRTSDGAPVEVPMAARDPTPPALIQSIPPYFDPHEFSPNYIFKSNLGQGAYGKVISVRSLRTNQEFAVKKLGKLQSRLRLIRALQEIRILSRLNHDCVTTMFDLSCLTRKLLESNSNKTVALQAIYITQPLMTTDLASVLQSGAREQLTSKHRKFIFYQLLRGMKYIHSANLSHRDLKPSRLLINEACQIKICDFGLARVMDVNADKVSETTGPSTEQVQTLWYRAPELLFRSSIYDQSLDVWSVGCILAELLNGKVLFRGASTVDQIAVVVHTMGLPNAEDVQYYTNIQARFPVNLLQGTVLSARPWSRLFPNVARDALDLLDQMLRYNPNERIKIDKALDHAYVATCREPHTETVCDRPFVHELSVGNWSEDSLHKLLLQWVARYQAKEPDWDSTALRNV